MIILLDCDGPLADLVGGILKVVNRGRQFHTHLKASDCTHWDIAESYGLTGEYVDEIMSAPGFVAELGETEGEWSSIRKLSGKGHKSRVVTSPFDASPHWMFERAQWLQRFGFTKHDIIFASDKSLIRGDVLVDDKPSNILHWCNAWPDGLGLLWDAPYNQTFDFTLPANTRRVCGWDGVMAEIEGRND